MFKNQYYYFVAGLPQFSFDSTKLPFTVAEFKEMLNEELEPKDKELIDKYFLEIDKINFHDLLADKTDEDTDTAFPHQELKDSIDSIKDDAVEKNKNWENLITSLYMNYGIEAKNLLVSKWYNLNLNIGNMLAAIYSRKYGLNVKEVIVGDNPIAETIRTNTNSRDFGIERELDYYETILRIAEDTDIYERERKIDKLRWDWLEENTVFDYFNIEYIFAYLSKLQILERWVKLNAEEGERVFRELIANMKKEVKVPDDEQ